MYSIKRNIENVVKQRAENSKAILLTGPRQVDKSTLLGYLYKGVNSVTFDDDLLLAQASDDPQIGGGRGIRTPVGFHPNGFQDRLVVTTSIFLQSHYNYYKIFSFCQ